MSEFILTTCGCNEPQVTPPPRCTNCGRYSHRVDDGYKIPPREGLLTEWFFRRWARHRNQQPPKLSGRITTDSS